jgi:hypothetical protein
MPFDETKYVEVFIKRHRSARVAPGDLISRYDIILPATDAEVSARIKAVRDYWSRLLEGDSIAARIARMCQAEDKRLSAEHGAEMETSAWWQRQQSARQLAIGAAVETAATSLSEHYGPLGMVTNGILDKLADQFNLPHGQARQAARRAGLRVVPGVPEPDTGPTVDVATLARNLSACGAASVPELVHPGAGPFSIVGRYACRDDPGKRLDEDAVSARIAEAAMQGGSATANARLVALETLRKALDSGIDLRNVTIRHLLLVTADSPSPAAAAAELQDRGLELADATLMALAAVESAATRLGTRDDVTGISRVPDESEHARPGQLPGAAPQSPVPEGT